MNTSQQIIDEIAFSIQHLSPEGRRRHLNDAYAHALAKHPDVTDPPVSSTS